ncbi:unnamed protein product [Lactuca saligna]|uniref:Uncharacterized protein n=1 Tax=Lactuca saligna TaxID=75948 RepID=A0AA35ZUU6_LACSI|nr:unnamed protein product [Lactuca saligna]
MDDNQGKMVVIQSEPVSDNQPKPKVDDDNSKTNNVDYEEFIDMEFMVQSTIPISFFYSDASSMVKIPQGTYNDIESDDDRLNPIKINASLLGMEKDIETVSSSELANNH